nr:hypothetical protein [Bacteroidota bacterium]
MKKLILFLMLMLVIQSTNLFAQDAEVVNFTAVLESVLNLNVTGGADQTATFDTPDLYNLGIDAVGTTTVTMESTSNWNLQINAANFSDGAVASIPIDNLGVWCEATGIHVIGGEVTCAYTALGSALGVTAIDQMLIDNGTGNGGAALDNAFNLNWTMGTMNGTMNLASMFAQLADGTIANIGTFTTTVNLTMTALP